MKSQYFDPNLKNASDEDDIIENDESIVNEESADTEEEVIDNEDHEWVNPTDLDAVDPEDIGVGEEYL